jgi:hypothetical protein
MNKVKPSIKVTIKIAPKIHSITPSSTSKPVKVGRLGMRYKWFTNVVYKPFLQNTARGLSIAVPKLHTFMLRKKNYSTININGEF